MGALTKRRWASIALLSVVLPVSLLVTFRLTGVLPEPQTPETITLDPVCWNMSRPSDPVNINEEVKNSYADGKAFVGLGVRVVGYHESDAGWPAYDKDLVQLRVVATAEVDDGFVYSGIIEFSKTDMSAVLYIPVSSVTGGLHSSMDLHNLELEEFQKFGTSKEEAYVRASGRNRPKECVLSILAYWMFLDEDDKYHQIAITLEGICFKEGKYQKVTIPIVIGIFCDAGDTFDTARQITPGMYTECLDNADVIDIYAININEGQTIEITMTPPGTANFDLFLYNPIRILVANSTQNGSATEFLCYIADSTGDWYIKAQRFGPGGLYGNGIYSLTIDIHE